MKIDYENITQSSQWFNSYMFTPYYRKLGTIHNLAYLRLTSPLIGIGDGVMSSFQALLGLGETLFKGGANTVYGIANRDQKSLEKGLLQIILGGSVIALSSIPIIVARTLRITARVAYDPQSAIADQNQKLLERESREPRSSRIEPI